MDGHWVRGWRSKSCHPRKFGEFAVGTEGSRLTAEGGRTVPSHKATAESPAFLDASRKPNSRGQL